MCKSGYARAHMLDGYAVYRVGAAWMFTSSSLEHLQKIYKVRINDYEKIPPG